MSKIEFRKKALGPFFFLFLLRKLPLAFIAGVKLNKLDNVGSSTSLNFGWINQNPFKSMYFAAMHMAAELATGLLLFQHLDRKTKFSMLLVNTSAKFNKKAIGSVSFTCLQAMQVEDFITNLINKPDGEIIELNVSAKNADNEEVASFSYTWSCKSRHLKNN